MEEAKNPTRVLIVDDHPLVRGAIAALLQDEKDFAICGEAEDAKTALSLIETVQPEIVILDIMLKGVDGFETMKLIKERFPNVKILIFSGRDASVYALRAMRAGASGYIAKTESYEMLPTALRKIAQGGIYLSQELETQFLKRLASGKVEIFKSPTELLSDRELEVFTLYGQGFGTTQIAEKLNLSIKTINAFRSNIKEKLHLESAVEVTHRAVQWVQNEGHL